MMDSDPYAPPASLADGDPLPAPELEFTPLRGRARFVAIAIAANCVVSLATYLLLSATPDASLEDEVATALAVAGCVTALIITFALAAIAYCVWIYAAARNVRALDSGHLESTPGMSVAYFFIPFANLVVPYRTVRGILDASDPSPFDASTPWRPPTGWVLPVWWAAWLGSNILGNVSMRLDDSATLGAVGVVSSVLLAIAGVTAVMIVSRISDGQERIYRVRRQRM
jgi:hypothetical protein